MQFLTIYKPAKPSSEPPSAEQMAQMQKFVEECMKNGTLVTTGSMKPAAEGTRVRLSNGDFSVLDGSGARESIGGFAILKTGSKPEAVELIKRFLNLAGDGEAEVHQLNEYGPQ